MPGNTCKSPDLAIANQEEYLVEGFSPITFLIATQSVSGPSAEPTDNSDTCDGGFCGRGTCLLKLGQGLMTQFSKAARQLSDGGSFNCLSALLCVLCADLEIHGCESLPASPVFRCPLSPPLF